MSEVDEALQKIQQGQKEANDELLLLVYDELRRLASSKLKKEKPGNTLQTTALVHEVYIRLVDVQKAQTWNGRAHFFAAASEAMRRILVERARSRNRHKRGGGLRREDLHDHLEVEDSNQEDLLALDEGLQKLAREDPLAARLVQLRYFVGLTLHDSAELLEISPRSADRLWHYARAWLHQEISGRAIQ